MAQTDSLLTFNVRRREPELIAPASPTPRELKPLSDIDDQEGLRIQNSGIQFYRPSENMKNKDSVSVIREALAKLLVFYYPFVGRLKEVPARKLMVDCTGDGVLFIEASADVTLMQFGDALQPPFPCIEELLYDVPGSSGILNSPLILIQVTRLLCGGFIITLRYNHAMSDGPGIAQFITGLGEMSQGASKPSILPVWQRELLLARDPPRVTCTHNEYVEVEETEGTIIPLDDMAHRSFFIRRADISVLRRLVPPHLQKCSTFEVLTANSLPLALSYHITPTRS
ncbi:benzyl alcohol O-benzoyltransferase [Tanacetum coccineum]|uniref:Benzyl alcohol O-benzoyltransferase n=1 Tax=Tanacetum coccineum TaxID=301880 RepID=A0ABQ5AKQ0_9ASTR